MGTYKVPMKIAEDVCNLIVHTNDEDVIEFIEVENSHMKWRDDRVLNFLEGQKLSNEFIALATREETGI